MVGWEEIRNELLLRVRWAGKSSLRNSVWAEARAMRENHRVSLWGEISCHTCAHGGPGQAGPRVLQECVGPLGLAAGTKYHTLENLKQQSLILYTSGARSPMIKVWAAPGSLGSFGGMNACLSLPGFRRWPLILVFWCIAMIYASDITWPFPFSLSLCLFSSCRDTSHIGLGYILVVCCSVAESYPAFCDLMDCSMPGFPVLHYLQEFAQTLVYWVGDAIQPSHLALKLITSIKILFLNELTFKGTWA